MTGLYTPFIVDDSFEPSVFVGDRFGDHFQEGLLAKPDPFLSMYAYKMGAQRDMLVFQSDSDGYLSFGDGSFAPQIYCEQAVPCSGQQPDFGYLPDGPLSTPAQKRVPLMASQCCYPANASFTWASCKPILTQEYSRKRKCDSPRYDVARPQNKPATVQLKVDSGCYHVSGQALPCSPLIPTSNSPALFHASAAITTTTRAAGHHYTTSTASQAPLTPPFPHNPDAWSPSFATVKTAPSPLGPMTPPPRPATTYPLHSSAPRFVRTSTIQQPFPNANATMSPVHTSSFSTYAIYPLKASLKLRGDVDAMTKCWTTKEVEAHRRLVEFKRSQRGDTINAEFKPVAPENRVPSSITISCIFWKEKEDYYVTSVDTIYLLEALVGVRFTIEEKNRIRRNLNGFRHATVSKSKTDSEEFFKIIMGFPHPKPRNIEKDVKVFPWKILSTALKKIISKYSVSYSSTASALITALPFDYGPKSSADYGYGASPHPEHAAPMAPFAVAFPTPYTDGQNSGRMYAPVTTAPVPELHLQVPASGPAFDNNDPYGFATVTGMPQASMLMTMESMRAPAQRVSSVWEFNYMHEDPASAPPNSAPPMAYHRGATETAGFETPAGYHLR